MMKNFILHQGVWKMKLHLGKLQMRNDPYAVSANSELFSSYFQILHYQRLIQSNTWFATLKG